MDPQSNNLKIVYIGGSARSGTGILGRVLSTMSGAAHGGELRRLWSRGLRPGRPCDCGRQHDECPIWSRLLVPGASYIEPSIADITAVQKVAAPEVHAWWHALKILRRRTAPATDSPRGRYLTIYLDLYHAFARETGASIILDNSKNPADAALLASAPNVTTYCVQIVRDPRGVLYSRRKRSSPDNPSRSRPVEAFRMSVYWVLRQLTFDAIRRRYGKDRSFFVDYERMVHDPAPVLRNACGLLGVPEPKSELRAGIPFPVPEVHGPDGNGRFNPTEVTLKVDDRWRSELHPFDRRLVTLLTFPLLLRYGFPIRTKVASAGRA